MSDVSSGNKKAAAGGNDWVAEELAKARANFGKLPKVAKTDAERLKSVQAGARIKALRDGPVYWSDTKLATYMDSNKSHWNECNKKAEAARKEYKEIEFILNNHKGYEKGSKEDLTIQKWSKAYYKETGKAIQNGSYDNDYRAWLLKKRKEAGKTLDDNKKAAWEWANNYYQCKFSIEYHAQYGMPTKAKAYSTVNTGDGKVDGSGGANGGEDGPADDKKDNDNKKEVEVNGQKYTEGKAYEKDGSMVIPLLDKDGNQVGYKFKDKEGKDQILMNDEIKKSSVKLDDVKKALEEGDIKKALELLLKALLDKQNNYENVVTNANDGGGKEPVITTEDYKDEATGVVFKVTKKDNVIETIAQGDEVFNRAEFDKAKIKPEEVEQALKANDFKTAGGLLFNVAAANGRLQPQVTFDNQTGKIILSDAQNQKFELDEKKLQEFGLKKGKAEKAMENLRDLVKSGQTNQSAAYIVASYFAKEQLAPVMPKTQPTYGSPKLNKNPGGKIISITVKDAAGNEKELGYKDFAKAFNCSEDEAKKIRKECIRVIKNGGNVDDVLSFTAENSEGKAKFWTKSAVKIGTYAAAGIALGTGIAAVAGAFKRDETVYSAKTADPSSAEKSDLVVVTDKEYNPSKDTEVKKVSANGNSGNSGSVGGGKGGKSPANNSMYDKWNQKQGGR